MASTSAGIAMYRRTASGIEIFLVHMGGPFWAQKDAGAWTFPKGEYDASEDPLQAARREFQEETSFTVDGNFIPLEPIKQRGGKVIYLWAVEGNVDADTIRSTTFSVEWPRGSGHQQQFPEVDRAAWFAPSDAKTKLVPGQAAFVDQVLLASSATDR